MKKNLITGLIVLSMILCSGLAMAWDYTGFGSNITVYDGVGDGSTGWHGNQENNEVEIGATTGQKWDLEAFYWNNEAHTLTMVGGYDFINGESWSGYDADRSGVVDPGFIFIDANSNNTWDYAIGWSYSLGTGANNLNAVLYDLNGGSSFTNIGATPFGASDPWRADISGLTGTSLSGQYLNFEMVDGERRNAITIDISGLTLGTEFSSHFTMECGNDNLMGHTNNVPIPSAIWLLGSGLLGLVGVRRRRQT